MKTLVIYYSYTGKTRAVAERIANESAADIIELKDSVPRSKLSAYLRGSFEARGQKKAVLQPFDTDFPAYDKIVIAMPIWAGYPAPAINNVIAALPNGKAVELVMTSGSGSSKDSTEKTKALIAARGCEVVKYQDIKS